MSIQLTNKMKEYWGDGVEKKEIWSAPPSRKLNGDTYFIFPRQRIRNLTTNFIHTHINHYLNDAFLIMGFGYKEVNMARFIIALDAYLSSIVSDDRLWNGVMDRNDIGDIEVKKMNQKEQQIFQQQYATENIVPVYKKLANIRRYLFRKSDLEIVKLLQQRHKKAVNMINYLPFLMDGDSGYC